MIPLFLKNPITATVIEIPAPVDNENPHFDQVPSEVAAMDAVEARAVLEKLRRKRGTGHERTIYQDRRLRHDGGVVRGPDGAGRGAGDRDVSGADAGWGLLGAGGEAVGDQVSADAVGRHQPAVPDAGERCGGKSDVPRIFWLVSRVAARAGAGAEGAAPGAESADLQRGGGLTGGAYHAGAGAGGYGMVIALDPAAGGQSHLSAV